MKKIVRISQKGLHELLMKETGGGFLSTDPGYKGASYRVAPEEHDIPPTPQKINVPLTEEQINFIEDIFSEVEVDNEKEKQLKSEIENLLRDSLVNSNK